MTSLRQRLTQDLQLRGYADRTVEAYVRAVAQLAKHVLPRGFTKIRYYGLLSPTGRTDLERARHLLTLHATPHAATASASTAREVALPDGGHANVGAADGHSGVDGETSRVAIVSIVAIPAVRRCPACGRRALRLVARYRRSRAPPS